MIKLDNFLTKLKIKGGSVAIATEPDTDGRNLPLVLDSIHLTQQRARFYFKRSSYYKEYIPYVNNNIEITRDNDCKITYTVVCDLDCMISIEIIEVDKGYLNFIVEGTS